MSLPSPRPQIDDSIALLPIYTTVRFPVKQGSNLAIADSIYVMMKANGYDVELIPLEGCESADWQLVLHGPFRMESMLYTAYQLWRFAV